MAGCGVNPALLDPYKNFKFRIKWEGRYVAGFNKVSPEAPITEVSSHRDSSEQGASRKSAGRSEYEAVTLERGITHDADFVRWANKVWSVGSEVPRPPHGKDCCKDVIIEVFNEAGHPALAAKLFRCWVSEYQSLPDLDASPNAVAIQHIKLENEGIEHDLDVPVPAEPCSGDA